MGKHPLEPNDFPVHADDNKLKTRKGKPLATAETDELADQIAEKLNDQADQEEQDRWSA